MASFISFDAYELLNIQDSEKGFCCVGHAPSQGRRCHNPINQADRARAKSMFKTIPSIVNDHSKLQSHLQELATLCICKNGRIGHQSQRSAVVSEWSSIINSEVARQQERRSPSPTDIMIETQRQQIAELQELLLRERNRSARFALGTTPATSPAAVGARAPTAPIQAIPPPPSRRENTVEEPQNHLAPSATAIMPRSDAQPRQQRRSSIVEEPHHHHAPISPVTAPAADAEPQGPRRDSMVEASHHHDAHNPPASGATIDPQRPLQRRESMVEPEDEETFCPICKEDSYDIVETSCGHRYCRTCITEWLEVSDTCPLDRRPLRIEDLRTLSLCSICLDTLEDIVETPCGHRYCRACIIEWLESHTTCPMDRRRLRIEDLHAVSP